jgi:hypothetical protein
VQPVSCSAPTAAFHGADPGEIVGSAPAAASAVRDVTTVVKRLIDSGCAALTHSAGSMTVVKKTAELS